MRDGNRLSWKMSKSRFVMTLLCVLFLGACRNMYSFKPYDYKKGEIAAVKKQKSPYSLGLKGKRLVFKKELPVLH